MPPATYEKLLVEAVPEIIDTEDRYQEIGSCSATWSARAGAVRAKKQS